MEPLYLFRQFLWRILRYRGTFAYVPDHTVDARNPAPGERWFIRLSMISRVSTILETSGFRISQQCTVGTPLNHSFIYHNPWLLQFLFTNLANYFGTILRIWDFP